MKYGRTWGSRLLAACGLALLASGCVDDSIEKKKEISFQFPDNFIWGTATASHQVESDNINSDWSRWETLGRIKDNQSNFHGPNHWTYFEQDFDIAKNIGSNAYRMSLEWSKIEYRQGFYDKGALEHYHSMLASLKRRGIKPFLTIQHFTLPLWIHDPTPDPLNGNNPKLPGWNDPSADPLVVKALIKFAGDMAREFGSEVDWWITINEPLVMYANGYLVGDFPPGIGYKNETQLPFPLGHHPSVKPLHEGQAGFGLNRGINAAPVVLNNIVRAHLGMYEVMKKNDTVDADGDGKASLISISKHHIVFRQFDDTAASKAGFDQMQYLWNEMFWDAIINAQMDKDLDGKPDEDLSKTYGKFPKIDYIGFNYYARRDVVPTNVIAPLIGLSPESFGFFKGFPIDTGTSTLINPKLEKGTNYNCLGWEIYPEGMKQIIAFYSNKYGKKNNLPIVITENGTDNDADRPGFVVDMIAMMGEALEEGHDVRGYLHWSLMDNFEWERGYGQHFGLVRVNFDNKTSQSNRTITEGGEVFKDIALRNALRKELVKKYGTVGNPENIRNDTLSCAEQGAK